MPARIPKIPPHYTDREHPAKALAAERLNRKRTVSLVLRRGEFTYLSRTGPLERTVHLSKDRDAASEARLKLADYEKHSIPSCFRSSYVQSLRF